MYIIRTLLTVAAELGVAQLLTRNSVFKRRLGRSAAGAGLVVIAGWTIWGGSMVLLAGLFFFLADLGRLVEPALAVGTIAVVLGGLAGWKGWDLLRR